MLGGLWIARRGRTQGLSRVMLGHALCALLGLSVFAASPYLPLTLAAVVTGGGLVVATAAAMSLIQNAVASDVRARVLSMSSVIGVGAQRYSHRRTGIKAGGAEPVVGRGAGGGGASDLAGSGAPRARPSGNDGAGRARIALPIASPPCCSNIDAA